MRLKTASHLVSGQFSVLCSSLLGGMTCFHTSLKVYDVTRRDSFDDLEAVWMREVELYSNVEGAVKILVANKVDLVSWL